MKITIKVVDCIPSFGAYQLDNHANTGMIAMDNFYDRLITSQQGSDNVGSIYHHHSSCTCVVKFPVSRLLIIIVISGNNLT